jgi:predicted phage tail protein
MTMSNEDYAWADLDEPGAIVPYGEGSSPKNESPPEEDPDSLVSRAKVSVLFMIGEGPIEGFARDADVSIFLDDTRLKTFKGVQYSLRRGRLNQSPLTLFTGTGQERGVGVELRKNQPITRTIDNPDIDSVRVRLATSGLRKYEDDGDIKGNEIEYMISIANQGGNFEQRIKRTLKGKTSGEFQFDFQMNLDKGGAPWRVRVERLSDNSEDSREQNDLYWQAYTEIVKNKFIYPRTALLGLRFDAKYFQNLPSVSVLLKGLIISVPSNYDPVARTYTGIWDGSFKPAWSNNPAWCLYDLITEPLYGCGRFIGTDRLDKWTLYAIGQYCDQMVPSASGGTEPRFTFNAYIQNREDAYQVIAATLSVFRGILFESWGGSIYTSIDSPSLPVRIYSESNVIQEVDENGNITKPPFQYSGTSAKVRHTVALVSYQDKRDRYRTKVAYVQDVPGLQRYGYRETQVTAFGCTSRGQANRLGRWTLLSEQLETVTVTFSVGSDGMLVRPGELIAVADPSVSGLRLGGRVKSYDPVSGVITIDQAVNIAPNGRILTLRSDGSARETPIYSTVNTVTDQIGTYGDFVGGRLDGVSPGSPYLIYFDDILEPQQFRVRSIEEDEEAGIFTITAIEHNPSKFNAVDYDQPATELPISVIPSPFEPPPPTSNLTAEEVIVTNANRTGLRVHLDITWGQSYSYYPCTYTVRYRAIYTLPAPSGSVFDPLATQVFAALQATPWIYLPPTPSKDYQLTDIRVGYYEVEVYAVNPYGITSKASNVSLYAYGLTKPPETPKDFRLSGFGDNVSLSWRATRDVDVQIGGSFEIRFSRFLSASWSSSQFVARVAGAATTATVRSERTGTFLIKAIDSSGIFSINSASVQFTSNITDKNYVYEKQFNLNDGETQSMYKFVGLDGITRLRLTSSVFFDSALGLFDSALGLFDSASQTFDSSPVAALLDKADTKFDEISGLSTLNKLGYWTSDEPFDLGGVFTCKVTGGVDFESLNEQPDFLSFAGSFDERPGLFDGQNPDIAKATIEISTSNNMIVWSEYQPLAGPEYTARGFKFRIAASTTEDAYNCEVKACEVEVDMPERFESGTASTDFNQITLVKYPNGGFYQPPEMAVTLQGALQGDFFVISNQTESGFSVAVYNGGTALSNIVPRSISYVVRGIGKLITD